MVRERGRKGREGEGREGERRGEREREGEKAEGVQGGRGDRGREGGDGEGREGEDQGGHRFTTTIQTLQSSWAHHVSLSVFVLLHPAMSSYYELLKFCFP